MRIGYIGHFGQWHTEWGVAAALEKWAAVSRYCYSTLDREKFTRREYDIVLTTMPHHFTAEFWRAQAGVKIAHYFDLVPGWRERDKAYFPKLREFDLVFATDGMNPAYREAGINCRWFPQAVNPEWYYPVDGEPERDVAFIGHLHTERRKRLVKKLGKRYDFYVFGGDNLCRGEAHARVCSTSKIMVADNATNNLMGYWSNRVYLHLACGAFLLHPAVPGMNRFFKNGVHLVYYTGTDDLCSKIDRYLAKDDERARIAEAGRKLVRSRHTWDVRMEEFWRILQEPDLLDTRTRIPVSACSCGNSSDTLGPTPYSRSTTRSRAVNNGWSGR